MRWKTFAFFRYRHGKFIADKKHSPCSVVRNVELQKKTTTRTMSKWGDENFPYNSKKPIIFYQSYFILFITVFFYVISIQMTALVRKTKRRILLHDNGPTFSIVILNLFSRGRKTTVKKKTWKNIVNCKILSSFGDRLCKIFRNKFLPALLLLYWKTH